MASVYLQVTLENEADREVLSRAVRAYEDELVRDGHRMESYWAYLTAAFDTDGDGGLDATEDAAATRYVATLAERPAELLEAFDLDESGTLDDAERAWGERVVGLWMGE